MGEGAKSERVPGGERRSGKKSRLVEASVVGRSSYRKRSYRRAGTEPPFNIANLLFFFFPGRLRQVFWAITPFPPSRSSQGCPVSSTSSFCQPLPLLPPSLLPNPLSSKLEKKASSSSHSSFLSDGEKKEKSSPLFSRTTELRRKSSGSAAKEEEEEKQPVESNHAYFHQINSFPEVPPTVRSPFPPPKREEIPPEIPPKNRHFFYLPPSSLIPHPPSPIFILIPPAAVSDDDTVSAAWLGLALPLRDLSLFFRRPLSFASMTFFCSTVLPLSRTTAERRSLRPSSFSRSAVLHTVHYTEADLIAAQNQARVTAGSAILLLLCPGRKENGDKKVRVPEWNTRKKY